MKQHMIILIISLVVLIGIVGGVLLVKKDKYVYNPVFGATPPNSNQNPVYGSFFKSKYINTEQSVNNDYYLRNCVNCNSQTNGFYKPLTPRNCSLCTSFVKGHTRSSKSGVL